QASAVTRQRETTVVRWPGLPAGVVARVKGSFQQCGIGMDETRQRSTLEVLEDHLRHRERAEVEEDIARNFADDVVIWSSFGLFRGHEGVRRSAHALHEQLRCAHYQFPTKLV